MFEVEIPPVVGEHRLEVKATVPAQHSRWYPGAGLYRPVRLLTGGRVGIRTRGVFARTTSLLHGRALVSVTTDLRLPDEEIVRIKETDRQHIDLNQLPNQTVGLHVRNRIYDGDGVLVAEGVKAPLSIARTTLVLPVEEARLWSPESPYLYTLVTEVLKDGAVLDARRERIGIRTVEFAADGFRLNGVVRKFRGVCLHHDLGPLGAAFNKAAFRRQVRLLKSMGCDSIRTAHNIPPPWQMEICDELGMMVMAESFDEWKTPKLLNGYARDFDGNWRQDLSDMVLTLRNHPSIVMWSIGNEVLDQRKEQGVRICKELQDFMHALDPSRKVTMGMSFVNSSIESGLIAVPDIPGYTYHIHRYPDILRHSPPGFVLGVETASTVSSRGVYHFPVPEHPICYQTERNCGYPRADGQVTGYDLIRGGNWVDDGFAMMEDNEWALGEFVWTGFDYLGEPTPYRNNWPSHSSYFGIFDLAGLPKDRYYLYRAHWLASDPTLHILPHWTWPGREGEKTPVFVYTSHPGVELFVNGVSQGVRYRSATSNEDRYRLRWYDVIYRPGELRAVAVDRQGNRLAEARVVTAGCPHHLQLIPDRTCLTALQPQDTPDLSFVNVRVVDADGNLCPDAEPVLSFEVTGAARFKCVANGDATSLESFVEPRMKAFKGELAVVVEAGDAEGTAKLVVSTQGLPDARVDFQVTQ